jgi:putative two-component system hydrogenase maturation factor HypX/HoxX
MIEAVNIFEPQLIICPFLKEKIPCAIWQQHKCIIIHPGIIGDRGPSSLDWAIHNNEEQWGVTALQAIEEMDAGDIWANFDFPMRKTFKASLYRKEVTKAAVKALHQVLKNIETTHFKPMPLNYRKKEIKGKLNPLMAQEERKINWKEDSTQSIINKINAADSFPGLLDTLYEQEYYLYGAHNEDTLKGEAGEIIARRNGAICKATIDGALWISHLRPKRKNGFKLPSAVLLKDKLKGILENRIPLVLEEDRDTFKEIYYTQKNDVGYLHFDFHNGAMSIEQCVRLKYAYEHIREEKDINVLVLMGGKEFFSNGIHLNMMEDSLKKAEDGWSNIHAMNDIVKQIIHTPDLITVASLSANAGAGGAIMALACDYVVAKQGVILNPHYKTLGLHGSEYWTYLLPKRIGKDRAYELTESCLPIGAIRAQEMGLIDNVFNEEDSMYIQELETFCQYHASKEDYYDFLDAKQEQRAQDEIHKPLEEYRKEELQHMYTSFYDENSLFNKLRCDFVYKVPSTQTPKRLALHRKT